MITPKIIESYLKYYQILKCHNLGE